MPRKNAKIHTEPSQEFQKKVLAERDFIFGWCITFTKHKQNAEDLCQDVLIHLLGSETAFKDEKSFHGWVYTVTKRIFINKFSKNKKRPFDYTDTFSSVRLTTEDTYFPKDELKEIMQTLPEQQREILNMKLSGFRTNEIAELHNRSTSAVNQTIRNARSEIQSRIKLTYRLRKDWPHKDKANIIIIPKDTLLKQPERGAKFIVEGYRITFEEELVLYNKKWFMQVKEPKRRKKPVQLPIFKNY